MIGLPIKTNTNDYSWSYLSKTELGASESTNKAELGPEKGFLLNAYYWIFYWEFLMGVL